MPKLLVTYGTVLQHLKLRHNAISICCTSHTLPTNVKLSIDEFEIENVDRGMCQPRGTKNSKVNGHGLTFETLGGR